MPERSELPENSKELAIYRRLLAIAGTVYLLWWFAVELLLPNSFNPFLSRFLVVLFIFCALAFSYVSNSAKRHLKILFIASAWLITAHYYYLFYGNAADINWIVGSYVTVVAISFSLFSRAALLSYSVFVILLSLGLWVLVPSLSHSVFFLGLATILFQANIGLGTRLTALKNLADSNERFQMLFNSTFEGVLVHQDGRVVGVNKSMARMFGYSQTEFLGRDAFDIIHPEERARAVLNMTASNGVPYETRGYTKSHQALDIEVRGKDFIYKKRPARLVTIQEIGDRKRAESERIAALTLKENVRVRDEFISIASHELKTPISSLMLQIQLLERDAKKGLLKNYSDEEIDEVFVIFNRQVSRLTELVETMLDVSRISTEPLVLDLKSFDLSALIHEVTGSSVSVEVPDSLIIIGDRNRVKQVVENLVTNGIKYGEGKPVQIKAFAEADEAVLIVEDQGLGIAPEFTERIFDRFERAISAKNISGLGLGLYITKQIVQAHGGSISVRTALGAGSVFTVRLPLKPRP
jgi:PAS domain S-box-containing protein